MISKGMAVSALICLFMIIHMVYFDAQNGSIQKEGSMMQHGGRKKQGTMMQHGGVMKQGNTHCGMQQRTKKGHGSTAKHGQMMKTGGIHISSGVDTSNPVSMLGAEMKDLQSGSTKIAYQLASPTERLRIAGPDGYSHHQFKHIMLHEIYKPLMSGNGYKVESHGHYADDKNQYYADLHVHTSPEMKNPAKFRFIMSLQHPNVVDQHDSLGPYKMHPGHQPVWRTDNIVLVQMKK